VKRNFLLEFDGRPILFLFAHPARHVLQVQRQLEQLDVLVRQLRRLDRPLTVVLDEFLLHVLHAPLQQDPVERVLPQELLLVLAEGAKYKLGVENGLPNAHQKLVNQVEQSKRQRQISVLNCLEHQNDRNFRLRYLVFPHFEQLHQLIECGLVAALAHVPWLLLLSLHGLLLLHLLLECFCVLFLLLLLLVELIQILGVFSEITVEDDFAEVVVRLLLRGLRPTLSFVGLVLRSRFPMHIVIIVIIELV